jgi:hypothetical protein
LVCALCIEVICGGLLLKGENKKGTINIHNY